MKMMKWLTAMVLLAGVVMWAGCGKKEGTTPAGATRDVNGVQVALPQLQQSLLATKDPALQTSAGKMAYDLRYGNLTAVQDELTKLAANPSLTEDQKKLVATVQDQMKQAVAAKPAGQ